MKNTNESPDSLFANHLADIGKRIDLALEHAQLDGLVIHAGHPYAVFQDDQHFGYRPNPWFSWLAPVRDAPDSLVIWRRGHRPRLVMVIPDDFWHLPPVAPSDPWVNQFERDIVSSREQSLALIPSGLRLAWFGEPSPPEGLLPNPEGLLHELQEARCRKSAYEIACQTEATIRGVAGHRAALRAFEARQAEYAIHMAFLAASGMTDDELPYSSIVALNEHAATMHYQRRDRASPPAIRSMLIDAGAGFRGYGSDITRTYAAAGGAFATLIDAMESLQQQLCREVRPGASWPALHFKAHHGVALLLRESGVLRGIDVEAAVSTGLTGHFLPHGLGHLLGLQVHDVGGFRPTPGADPLPTPPGHPALRLTRELAQDFVVTVEPGVYFIPSLLAKLQSGALARHVDWSLVDELRPCGGIRIEDNVLVTAGGHRNLTREAFAREAGAAAA